MRWLLRLIVALSLVSIACLGIIALQLELPFAFGKGDLLFGIAVIVAFVAWLMLKDRRGR